MGRFEVLTMWGSSCCCQNEADKEMQVLERTPVLGVSNTEPILAPPAPQLPPEEQLSKDASTTSVVKSASDFLRMSHENAAEESMFQTLTTVSNDPSNKSAVTAA